LGLRIVDIRKQQRKVDVVDISLRFCERLVEVWGEEGLVDSLVVWPFVFWFSLRVLTRSSAAARELDRRSDHDVIDKDPYVLPVRYFYPHYPVCC